MSVENSQWFAIADSALKEGMPLPFDLFVVLKKNHKRLRVRLKLHLLLAEEIEHFRKLSTFETNHQLFELDQIAGIAKLIRLQSEGDADPRRTPPSFVRSRKLKDRVRQVWRTDSGTQSVSMASIVVFVSHLIDLRLSQYWVDLFHNDVTAYEKEIRLAMLRVFLAAHIGYSDIEQLRMIFAGEKNSTVEFSDLEQIAEEVSRFGGEQINADRLLVSESPVADLIYSSIVGASTDRRAA